MSESYELRRFEELFNDWLARDKPGEAVLFAVLSWAFSRAEDPYADARREEGFPNLWSVVVPNSLDGGRVVFCSYWIIESEHAVRFDSVVSLSWPV